MITITEAAQAHFRKLLSEQLTETHIRVFVTYPGSPHAECGVSYCPIEAVEESDLELPFTGFSAYIDQQSAPFLQAAEIDFVTNQLGAQLTLKAPHAKMVRVADDAPLTERVDYLLQSTINPQLAAHGGRVTLIKITEEGYALLQFGGGCNGCAMVDVTLKEGIEKELLNHFPELKGVQDVTEHQTGEHSYY